MQVNREVKMSLDYFHVILVNQYTIRRFSLMPTKFEGASRNS